MCGSGLEAEEAARSASGSLPPPPGGLWPGVTMHSPVVILRPEAVSIGRGSRVDAFVKIEGGCGVSIGRNVHIASYCHLNIGGGSLHINDGACLASGVRVVTGSHSLLGVSCSSCCPESEQVVERGHVAIREHAIVWTGAILLPGVNVMEGAAVGAGSVVRHDVPAWEVWAGNPARFIKQRERPAPGRSARVEPDGVFTFDVAAHVAAWGGVT